MYIYLLLHLLLLRLFPLGGVSGPNSCSVLCILQGDPQFLHVPSDTIHPSPSWSPFWSFSWHYHINNCFHFIIFFILCICPYHLSLIPLIFSCMLFTPSSFLMSALFTLTLSVTRLILLNILISVFLRIYSSFYPTVQHSAPYRSTGLMTVM